MLGGQKTELLSRARTTNLLGQEKASIIGKVGGRGYLVSRGGNAASEEG